VAVKTFFGKTGSGKSYRANLISHRDYDRVFIFDNAHCFKGNFITSDLSAQGFSNLLKKIAKLNKFRVVFRPSLSSSPKESCEIVSQFLFAHFGALNKKLGWEGKLLFLVDEADKVSSDKKDAWLYKMVTMGRHLGFDSFGISQGPGRIPKYWRENSSEVFCFKVMEHEFLKQIFGPHAQAIPLLGEYEYLHWSDVGDIRLRDKNDRMKKWGHFFKGDVNGV
jgi:hypothetical protein